MYNITGYSNLLCQNKALTILNMIIHFHKHNYKHIMVYMDMVYISQLNVRLEGLATLPPEHANC